MVCYYIYVTEVGNKNEFGFATDHSLNNYFVVSDYKQITVRNINTDIKRTCYPWEIDIKNERLTLADLEYDILSITKGE